MKRAFSENTWQKNPAFKALCRAFTACKTEKEVANFLRDIGTLSELQAWSERLETAKELQKGLPYRMVSKKTGASTTTVTRVAVFLLGEFGGYKTVLKRIDHSHLQDV